MEWKEEHVGSWIQAGFFFEVAPMNTCEKCGQSVPDLMPKIGEMVQVGLLPAVGLLEVLTPSKIVGALGVVSSAPDQPHRRVTIVAGAHAGQVYYLSAKSLKVVHGQIHIVRPLETYTDKVAF